MRTDDFAVTLVLRVAIITTSIAGSLAMLTSIWFATTSERSAFYGIERRPNVVAGLAMLFGSVMWTSILLSFLLYMSWRVRLGASGATSPAGFYPPGNPTSGANARRQANSY